MPAALRIADGNPIWLSLAIVPSKDTVVSPGSSPTLATVQVNSTGVFTYVKVENTGTVDLGTCTCSPVPAPWPVATLFGGFWTSTTTNTSQTQAGVTFSTSGFGDSLSGGVNYSFGLSASGRRAWAWSPDGRFFAYVGSPNGNDWYLTVVALQAVTRSNGTVINKGQAAVSGASGLFGGPFNNSNFGWAGSKAVIAAGTYAGGNGIVRSVSCPEAPGSNTWGELIPDFPGQIGWTHLSSPCGSVVALVPRILAAGQGNRDVSLISTATASPTSFRKNNVQTGVTITFANPTITTNQHAANGVRVKTGPAATDFVDVDDPDCTLAGGGVVVTVDRVKASTLPSANLGVLAIGTSSLGLLRAGQFAWVQVPNTNPSGWGNQSEKHWCLLAQAYTADGTTIARPWNGQAATPPPFPVTLQNCAQRNIDILP